MELKVVMSVFSLIFLAELGDKTQLATLAFAGTEQSKWSVFVGASLALVAASALATLLGGFISQYLPAAYVSRAAGVMFIAFGIIYIVRP